MRLNEDVIIEGSKCILVPYTKDLVEQYHSWFVADPELLDATGSELLTIEEEYENQESWRTDESKLTFLIRDKTTSEQMLCGDINCFFSDFEKDQFVDCEESSPDGLVGEINIMIAEKASRRKGIAEEALEIFTQYMQKNIVNLRVLVAKIQMKNKASIRLFEKMGYVEFKRVECFEEIHYVLKLDPSCF